MNRGMALDTTTNKGKTEYSEMSYLYNTHKVLSALQHKAAEESTTYHGRDPRSHVFVKCFLRCPTQWRIGSTASKRNCTFDAHPKHHEFLLNTKFLANSILNNDHVEVFTVHHLVEACPSVQTCGARACSTLLFAGPLGHHMSCPAYRAGAMVEVAHPGANLAGSMVEML